jgi:hypothetical protein
MSADRPEDVEDDDITRIMQRVLEAEKGKLHMTYPQGINNEIQSIIEEEVD